MPVFVNNLQEKVKVDNRLLDTLSAVVETALKVQNRKDDPEVSIALVDDMYIRDLNFNFRHIDKPTDVLSFPMDDPIAIDSPMMEDEDNLLGDIIVSMETAERQAAEYGHSLLREMAYLTAHGMFHLLGYDHDVERARHEMRDKEEKVMSILDITR